MTQRLYWGNKRFDLEFETPRGEAPWLAAVATGDTRLEMPPGLPLVEVLTPASGRALASGRLVHTVLGEALRLQRHEAGVDETGSWLHLYLAAPEGLQARLELKAPHAVAAFQASVTVRNGTDAPVLLQSVTSWSTYLGASRQADGPGRLENWTLAHAHSDWLGEGRWSSAPLRGFLFPELAEERPGHNPRGSLAVTSNGTWSTGAHLPLACVQSATDSFAWAWQIEHNGPWRWDVGEDQADGYFALSGPTDTDHQWSSVLKPGDSFTSVPVAVSLGHDGAAALAAMTDYRRAVRRPHPDNIALAPVYNDYMNTLNGDPTTAKLLPLVDAAAGVGAKIFCIDAGWYDDNHDWFDSVGQWAPSTTRFPGGLGEILDRIRQLGMTPGLWLEPEAVGVRSPVARALPHGAFLQRHGQRVVEQGRYHLDLRHPAACAHLDAVIDRLVGDFGIGYFKLDYNISAGPGTDLDADSVGDGLLGHNRAHLQWLEGVLDRHPGLILENCASGAMRSDFAMTSRLQLQSTSDQQDYLRYPPIAAAAPALVTPEQAANWAYPAEDMDEEETAFTLATSLLGRFYLSGHLNRLTAAQLDLVREAVAANAALRELIGKGRPFWPLGTPEWDAPWVALGLQAGDSCVITVWSRDPTGAPQTLLQLPQLAGSDVSVDAVFPRALRAWASAWDAASGTLRLSNTTGGVSARTLALTITAH
jgi:alpha-galactosidase